MLELVTVGDSQRKSMRNLKETEGNELLRKVQKNSKEDYNLSVKTVKKIFKKLKEDRRKWKT